MKKSFLMIAALALVMMGCNNEDISFDDLVLGMWVNTHVNNQAVLTDATFITEYRADLSQLYAIGLDIDENNKSWIENTAYTYLIDGKTITVEGPDDFDNYFYMEFSILSLDEDTMKYVVNTFRINGEEFPDPDTYTLAKVKTDLTDDFVGTWYGRNTTPGASETYHYWDYFADGTFDYYYQDEDENWVNKPDNDGEYFLYGNLLSSNYSNDLQRGGTGRNFECWDISINDNMMTWHGLRGNGVVVTFEMEKVDGPPL
jgi:hypothetical protein